VEFHAVATRFSNLGPQLISIMSMGVKDLFENSSGSILRMYVR